MSLRIRFKHKNTEDAIRTPLEYTDRKMDPQAEITEELLPTITELWYDAVCTQEDLSALISDAQMLPNLKNLVFDTGLEDLSPLTALKHLEDLEIEYWGNVFDFTPVGEMSSLKSILISGGMISDMALVHPEALVKLSNLKALYLHEFGSVDLSFLKGMPQIEEFHCGWGNDVGSIEAVATLSELKELWLDAIYVQNLDFLEKVHTSVSLELSCNIRDKVGIDYIRQIMKGRDRADIYDISSRGYLLVNDWGEILEEAVPFYPYDMTEEDKQALRDKGVKI